MNDFNKKYEKLMLFNPQSTFKKFINDGTFEMHVPEFDGYKYIKQNPYTHPEITLDNHVYQSLYPAIDKDMIKINNVATHDIGKHVTKNGTRFPKHDTKGVPIAEEVLIDLERPDDEIDCILYCVENHMKIHNILRSKPSERIKFYEHEHFKELCFLYYADTFMRPKQCRLEDILKDKQLLIESEMNVLVTEDDIKNYGIEGNEVSVVMNDIVEKQVSGKITTRRNALNYIKNKYVKWNFGSFGDISPVCTI